MLSKRILVTGASGSIGSALLARLEGAEVLGIDIEPGAKVRYGDIREPKQMDTIFEQFRPEIVFHTAALKHVPQLENRPIGALQTNVVGTYNIAMAAQRFGTGMTVLLSTDKAVRPTSVMGATKSVCESMFAQLGSDHFRSLRLVNVYASRGSVVPIFNGQIANGGPVTVTDARMKRFFMTVAQAIAGLRAVASCERPADIFVPDPGEPVEILSLARNLMRDDREIRIEFTGIRPGEKLSEELNDPAMDRLLFVHDTLNAYERKHIDVLDSIPEIRRAATSHAAFELLRKLVPAYATPARNAFVVAG